MTMNALRVYTAGQMRNVAEFNFPAFNIVTSGLRRHGYEVFNPAERDMETGFDPTGMTGYEDLNDGTHRFNLREALAADVAWICEKADAICLLPGWENSSGARAEMALAAALGLKAGYAIDFFATPLALRSAAEILALPVQPTVLRQGDTATFLPSGEVHIGRPLFGLGGYARSGKDALVDGLVSHGGFKRTYMSKPLEQALLKINPFIVGGIRYADLHREVGYDASKLNPEVRRLLQVLGTDVGRDMFGENVWVDKMRAEVTELLDAGERVAVTGIRFPSEIRAIREMGGVLLWIERPGYGPVNGHSSDNALSAEDFDLVVQNDGGLNDLFNWALDLVGSM